ncbi:MAG: 5-formyltetrahydrofolate cyclo-ligase [Kiritimatiellae bacterium]|nr:5-formyltetrahydrofolate cyclo-ligase [Kiritimatiellia bacterium]
MSPKEEQEIKENIRENIRQRLRVLDPTWVIRVSEAVQERLMRLREFTGAGSVCVYLPLWGEVRTNRIMDKCLREKKLLAVPAYDAKRNCYRPARLDRYTRYLRGPHGVPQPAEPVWLEPECVDLVVVPGLAFDLRCGRVGRGAGCFDALLARMKLISAAQGTHTFLAGLAFDFQIYEAVPMLQHDIFMDAVVTESRVIVRYGTEQEGKTG